MKEARAEVIREQRKLRFDWGLLTVTVALCAVGLATLWSAAGSPFSEDAPAAFSRQMIFMGGGLVGMVGLAFIDPRVYERLAYTAWGGGEPAAASPSVHAGKRPILALGDYR